MRLNNKISLVAAIITLFIPTLTMAATQSAEESSGNYNMALISLVCLMLVLLFVIGMLATTLRQLTMVIRDKMRKEKETKPTGIKSVLLLAAFSLSALSSFGAEVAAKPATNMISGIPTNDFYAIFSVLVLEIAVIFALAIYIRLFLNILRRQPETAQEAEKIARKSWFWDKFNAAATIEQEKDILLDHDYDGIQELDNSLPPWWKYGFYLTIIVGVIYLYRFHVSHDGPSSKEEYVEAMQQAEEQKAAYLAKSANNVDESTVTLLTDPNEIAAGKEIFVKTCVACHLADGGGSVGPNLTDEYWLHGGSIKDIFKTIKYGWQDKGMKSWKDDFSPKQIQELASFVKSLKGTHPAVPKAPQGQLYIEATNGGSGSGADSTNVKTDSAKTAPVAAK